MICKLCGKDTAKVVYDRVLDRYEVQCDKCNAHVLYTFLRSKEEVIKAYEGPKEAPKAEEVPTEPKKAEKKRKARE